jgi:predicted nucleic acid-binding protein
VGLKFALDSNVIIYEIDGRLASPLPAGAYVVSVVSKIELLSYPGISAPEEKALKEFLESVTVLGVEPDVVDEAIRLRKKHRLRLPDAIIAATATLTGSELLTHDAGLLKLPGLKVSAPRLRPV